MDGWVCGWMGGSGVNGRGQVKSLTIELNLDLIEMIQLCLNIYDL